MSDRTIFHRLGIAMFFYILLWVGIQLGLGLLIEQVNPQLMEHEWFYWLLSMGPMYVIAFPVAIKLLKRLPSRKLYEKKLHPGHFLQLYFMAVALMLIGNILGMIVTTVLTNVTGTDFGVSIADSIVDYRLIWIFLITVLAAPIIEELLFRKLLIDRLIVFGDGTAIVLSAIMFGLTHGNFTQVFYATFIGLIFGFTYVRTGKVRYSIGLHMLFNFMGGFVPAALMKRMDITALEDAFLRGDFMEMIDTVTNRIGALIGFIGYEFAVWGLGIAGFVLLIVNRKKFLLHQGELVLSKKELLKNLFTTPGMLLWMVAIVALFVINVTGI